jgi:pimeloyl-ACP methyl ester carboxylesterase
MFLHDVQMVSTRTEDGVLLHGAYAGEPSSGTGILAVHGAWGNFYATPPFELLRAAPRRGLLALSMNTRDHDLATLGDGEPSIGFSRCRFEDAPLDLLAATDVLRGLGVERFVVVAHSFASHKVAYWLAHAQPEQVCGLVMLSPAPRLNATTRWFVDGSLEHHVARAAAAVAAGDPQRLIVLGSHAPVPMVVEAATLLSVWGPQTLARSELHLPDISIPMLATSGAREPAAYRDHAQMVADSAGAEFMVLDEDHYYSVDRAGMAERVLDWIDDRHLLDTSPSPGTSTAVPGGSATA